MENLRIAHRRQRTREASKELEYLQKTDYRCAGTARCHQTIRYHCVGGDAGGLGAEKDDQCEGRRSPGYGRPRESERGNEEAAACSAIKGAQYPHSSPVAQY